MSSRLASVDAAYRDMYPRAGDRIKQWVIDRRREDAWEGETCPRFAIAEHDDTGMPCSNGGRASTWMTLNYHGSCSTCGVLATANRDTPEMVAWFAERAARPPITADRSALSDEIAPDLSLRDHPLFKVMRRT